jgi:chromosome partitioning protein
MQASIGVRRGLGWPEAGSGGVSWLARRASAVGRPPAPSARSAALITPMPESALEHETGIGWPDEPTLHMREESGVAGTGSGLRPDGPGRPDSEVSRETPAAVTAAADAERGDVQGKAASGLRGEPAPAGEPENHARLIPRHAAVRRSAQRRPDSPAAKGRSEEAIRSVAEERRVWAQPAEGSIRGARALQGRDGPMIAGTYSGALTAPGESENDVAIPAPDTSADTPIARAAQAAMMARSGGQTWPRPKSCRILTIANQKGGVGKTTTAVNLAASLAMNGSRVLVVDLDPQGNASTALDVEHRSGTPSIYNVLVDGTPMSDVVRPVDGFTQLFCVPATIDLAGSEIELVPLVAREARLSRAISAFDASGLDYMFIDCPPSLGLLTVNALVAAPEVLIPIQCEYYALEGLEQLLRTIDLVKSHLNPGLTVTTILLTMYDSRTRLASQVADEVRGHFGELVLTSVIPRSVRVSEAPSYGQSVMTYDPGSSGALAYLEAAREMAFRSKVAGALWPRR